MGQGVYKAGIDYPFILIGGSGVPSQVSLLLRNQEGAPEFSLSCVFMFISGANASASITIPSTYGESRLSPRNGIIQLNWLAVYPSGFLRIIAFSGNYLAANGICRYDTAAAERSRGVRVLRFNAQRSAHSATQSSGTTDTSSRSRTAGTSVTSTTTVAPGGMGGSVAFGGSESNTRGSSTSRSSGRAVTQPVAGTTLLIEQIAATH